MFHLITPDDSKPFSIGREESNDLRFADLFVSRKHALITKNGKDWFITSLTKNSVTKLNDEDVETAKLSDGDIIVIGVRRLRVNLNEDRLSLLILDLNEELSSHKLTNEWQEIPSVKSASVKAKFQNSKNNVTDDGIAEISCGKIYPLKNGETARINEYEITFREKELLVTKVPTGFDVSVSNLDVFAGKKRLLHDINFELKAGDILAIIGRSGQGKSSLLRLLEGIHRKGENSEVLISGIDYRQKKIREKIAILEQDATLRKDLTVKETILHGGRISLDKKAFDETAAERFEKFVELFGLSERIDSRVQTLSGGELRRTALAMELMGNPGLIILDEPLSGLDPYNSRILCTLLKQLAFLGHTIILTTHSYEALKIANKVLVIHKGAQGFFGHPKDAYRYFKTSDPDAILSGLDDDTAYRWKNTQESSTTNLRKKYRHVIFPRIHRKGSFFYGMGLTLKQWFRDKGKLAALILQPVVIGFLFSQIFGEQSSLWTVAFALILCANWFALSLSIREFVQEKSIFKDEFRKGERILSILIGKIAIPTIVSFLQTLIVFEFVAFRISVHPGILPLSMAFLCVVLPAVGVGLLVSALSRNAGQANAYLPLLIIPQVALAGALVPLDQMQSVGKALSYVIWSRYNQETLLNLFLERPDDVMNKPSAIALALGFYIITAIVLHWSKKAK